MRSGAVARRVGCSGRWLVLGAIAAAILAPAPRAATAGLRILYAGDWTGSMQIFAADLSGRAPLGQLTFDRPPGPCHLPTACGFSDALPSPDGRWLAYWSRVGFETGTLLLARADGAGVRELGPAYGAAWSPDSRRLAYSAADGTHVVVPGGAAQRVARLNGSPLAYSPDGRTLAELAGNELILLRDARARILARDALTAFAWSPDGRWVAYGTGRGISELSAAGGRPRVLYRAAPDADRIPLSSLELAFSPDGGYLAFQLGAIHMLDTRSLRVRLTRASGRDLAWAPDGSRLLFVPVGGSANGDTIVTGDVSTVTPGGHIETVVAAAKPYGGQLVSAAWTTPAPGIRYRPPEQVDGTFAGGPVQELAADGGRVAFIACGGVSVWTPATGSVVGVEQPPWCDATFSRHHVYSLGLAGDR